LAWDCLVRAPVVIEPVSAHCLSKTRIFAGKTGDFRLLRRAQVQFLDTKNGRDRGVPLHPDLVSILAKLPHREGCVFRKKGRLVRPAGSNSGEYVELLGEPYAPLDPNDSRDVSAGSRIKKGFKAATKRAKIINFRPHDCRHTWATWHYQENRDLNMLMHLGGWSSLSMVLRYAHVNVAHAAPSIKAMPSIAPTPASGQDASPAGVPGKTRAKADPKATSQATRKAS
jgi:integrase